MKEYYTCGNLSYVFLKPSCIMKWLFFLSKASFIYFHLFKFKFDIKTMSLHFHVFSQISTFWVVMRRELLLPADCIEPEKTVGNAATGCDLAFHLYFGSQKCDWCLRSLWPLYPLEKYFNTDSPSVNKLINLLCAVTSKSPNSMCKFQSWITSLIVPKLANVYTLMCLVKIWIFQFSGDVKVMLSIRMPNRGLTSKNYKIISHENP